LDESHYIIKSLDDYLVPYITSQLLPTPSRQSIKREKAGIRQQAERQQEEMVHQQSQDNDNIWEDKDFRDKIETLWKEAAANEQKVEDSYLAQMQIQTHWSGMVARLSPLTSFNLAALELGATGIAQEVRFVDALKTYSKTWKKYVAGKKVSFEKFLEETNDGRNTTDADWERFKNLDFSDYPRFSFQYMGFKDRLAQIYVDVLLLAVWSIAFFMIAHLSFLRYDVR
jgi:hypothetical protein